MHYKGHIITKDIPTQEKLSEILKNIIMKKSLSEEFNWDWLQIGGRYGGKIKINFDIAETEEGYSLFKERNHKYFLSGILDNLKEELNHFEELDILFYMGLKEDILYVDGGFYNDMIDFDISECFLVIDDEEKLYIREKWNGEDWTISNRFEEEIKQIDLTDKFITIIDFHS